MSPPPDSSEAGPQAENTTETQTAGADIGAIQQRIDALLTAWNYAGPEMKESIKQRIDALQIAATYASEAQ